MATNGAGATNSLEPNLSSTLAQLQHQVAEAGDELSLLKMSLCGSELFPRTTLGLQPTIASLGSHLQQTDLHHKHHYLLLLLEQQQQQQQQQQQHQCHAAANITAPIGKPLTKLVLDHVLEPMQSIDNTVDYYFSEIWTKSGDERTSKLPLMSAGPWKLIYATLVYLYLIKWLLPKTMGRFRALELNWCIRAYNLLMVLSNMYAFYHGARILSWGFKCFGCEVINHRDYSPQAMELLHYGWLFLLSRIIEWLDTIFFVLRKKERQVTKLHVFHHSFVPILCWFYLKFHPGYSVAFFPFVNTFVHTIMYTYYLLATFGPRVQAYLWWKKYLTSLQIAQFVLILVQLATIPLSTNDRCQYPRAFLYVAFAGAILFLWLFYTYYIDTYKSASKQQQQQLRRKSSAIVGGSGSGSILSGSGSILSGSGNAGSPEPALANRNDASSLHTSAWPLARPTHEQQRPRPKEGSSDSFADFIDNAIGAAEQTMSLGKRTSSIRHSQD